MSRHQEQKLKRSIFTLLPRLPCNHHQEQKLKRSIFTLLPTPRAKVRRSVFAILARLLCNHHQEQSQTIRIRHTYKTSLQSFPLHDQHKEKIWLLYATLQHNDRTSPSLPVIPRLCTKSRSLTLVINQWVQWC